MTNKQIRQIKAKYETKPGYILDLSRKEFEILFEDALDIEVFEEYEGPSVGKTFTSFLKNASQDQINVIITELDKRVMQG